MDSLDLPSLRYGQYHIAEPSVVYGYERPTVYLDTTIPSYLLGSLSRDLHAARRQRMTRVWWKRYRVHCDLYISHSVKEEVAAGRATAAAQRLRAISNLAMLEESVETRELAQQLVGGGQLPPKAISDAEHISIAAVHSVRFLLTWNYKHLANEIIARNVARTCRRLGYQCPEICTPEKLMRALLHERFEEKER